MKLRILSLSTLLVAACATTGGAPEFSATGVGTVSAGVACVTEEVRERGWVVDNASDAGLVRAESGPDWIEARLLPGQELAPAYLIEVTTSNTAPARELGSELVVACGS